MEAFSSARMMMMIDLRHRLRHLGLSHNALNSKTVEALLEPLKTNTTLTSLDLSYNEVDHSKESNEMLRTFLRCNSGLRCLDLCCNKLNAETFRELHLGLLENHTMLLLPLAGNPSADLSPTIHLIQVKLHGNIIIIIMTIIMTIIIIIQVKLRENRLAYKAGTQEDDYTFTGKPGGGGGGGGGGSVAYQSEEELGLRISLSDEQARSALQPQLHGDRADEQQECGIIHHQQQHQQQIQSAAVSMMIMPTHSSSSVRVDDGTPVVDATTMIPGGQSTAAAVAMTAMQSTATASIIIDDSSIIIDDSSSSPVVVPAVFISDPPVGDNSATPIAVAIPPTASSSIASSASGIISARSRNASLDSTSTSTSPLRPTATAAGPTTAQGREVQLRRVKSLSNADLPAPPPGFLQSSSSSIIPVESFSHNTLNVLFSAPLAFVNTKRETVPLEVLDYNAERELLMQVFKEVHRDVSVHFDFATTDALRTALTLGTTGL